MRIRTLALAGAATAVVAAYLFDPVRGRERRGRLLTSIRSFVDRGRRTTVPPALPENVAPRAQPDAIPAAEPMQPISVPAMSAPRDPATAGPEDDAAGHEDDVAGPEDDVEVVHRVKATLEARRDLRADDLVVDVVNGVVYLSGSLRDTHTFGEIVDVTRDVPGVRRVQSLLHLPDSETVSRAISARRVGDGSQT